MVKNSCVLCISDLHVPFHHESTIRFLREIKKALKPDKIIFSGDEIDGHFMSFHEKDPDIQFSPSSELATSIEYLKEFYNLFPDADIMESNHGSLVYRRAKYAGLPRHVLKSYNEILEAPNGWRWHDELVETLSDKSKCLFTHGRSANSLNFGMSQGMHVVQGHFHSKFDIQYWANSTDLYWAMTIGCLINRKEMAFNYGKLIVKKPIVGVGVILDGHPKLLPMILDAKGNWNGKIV